MDLVETADSCNRETQILRVALILLESRVSLYYNIYITN